MTSTKDVAKKRAAELTPGARYFNKRLMTSLRNRKIDVVERPQVPWLSLVLGYGPMLTMTACAVVAWVGGKAVSGEATRLAILYAASIMAFLAGVRRGLSFRTEGGPAFAQVVTMFGLFVAALFALVVAAHGFTLTALISLIAGYLAVMVLDPIAARAGQAPLFFARLRPFQIAIAVLSLLALAAKVWRAG